MNGAKSMVSTFNKIKSGLFQKPKYWLITGVAGFIGSNLLEFLLRIDQTVIGLDNFSTGLKRNLDEVRENVSTKQWSKFSFIEGDICDLECCRKACSEVDYVLHQAALGSVPRSIADPIASNAANVTGFLNMLIAARDAQVKGFVYAASSSTYGDHTKLPKTEDIIGKPLSPYAVTKLVNELYAEVFARNYAFTSIGLRYFNVFGKRQNPDGAYAAVIPKWIKLMIDNQPITINGNGETSRDFCYIENTIQANILAACTQNSSARNQVYNVALNERVSLNKVFFYLKESLKKYGICYSLEPIYGPFRHGDILHSQADITKIKTNLGYEPYYRFPIGIDQAMPWYVERYGSIRLSVE